MIYRSYKTQLIINDKQQTILRKNVGCARWAFNWALDIKKQAFDNKQKIPSYIDLSSEFTKLKKTAIPWMYESSRYATQNALIDCDAAFKNFFTRCKKKIKGNKGFPKYKSRRNGKQSFKLHGNISVGLNYIMLPRIGKVKLCQLGYIPTNCKILSATISTRAGKWFVSVNIETPDKVPSEPINKIIGVDLGIKNLATCSDGSVYQNPKALKANLTKLKRRQRNLSRKVKGSNNYTKARKQLARLHYRISNVRKDCLHKVTTRIINENQVIVLEDLNISGMLKNHKLARAISDMGFYEIRRQIEYKAKWNGRDVIIADRFYPSSKMCSGCGWIKADLTLKDRVFNCQQCKLEIDRDLNASLNLKQYTGGLPGIEACGDRSSSDESLVSLLGKQELDKGSVIIF